MTLDRLLRRKNGNTELDLVQPAPVVRTECPHCGEMVRLNDIIRSGRHTLGCTECYRGGV